LVYAPSASILFRDRESLSHTASGSCLALGYNGEGQLQLRFAEEEALSVARQTGGEVLVGNSPKRAVLYAEANQYRLLHFSCHGEFEPEAPMASALHLAPDEALTALDILNHLRLHCDLVTLSACESGLSRVRRGDELVGLMRAFMHAGAAALLSTLWRVDERSTLILMDRFYQNALAGMGLAEALKEAQLHLKGLTRREAWSVMARLLTDKILSPITPLDKSSPEHRLPVGTTEKAGAYLKGPDAGGKDTAAPPPSPDDDEKVFADPYYWAPFVLVGDRGTSAQG
jgi:CHAT domain-containing protein